MTQFMKKYENPRTTTKAKILVVIGDTLTLLLANQRMGDVPGPTVRLDDLAEVGAICSVVAVQGPIDDWINSGIRQPASKNAATATSLAALSTAGMAPSLFGRP
jgi:hypothetical protein